MEMNEKLVKRMMIASGVLFVLYLISPAMEFGRVHVVYGWGMLLAGVKAWNMVDPWYIFYSWLGTPLCMAGAALLCMSFRTGNKYYAYTAKVLTFIGVLLGLLMFFPFSTGIEYELGMFWYDTSLRFGAFFWLTSVVTMCVASAIQSWLMRNK